MRISILECMLTYAYHSRKPCQSQHETPYNHMHNHIKQADQQATWCLPGQINPQNLLQKAAGSWPLKVHNLRGLFDQAYFSKTPTHAVLQSLRGSGLLAHCGRSHLSFVVSQRVSFSLRHRLRLKHCRLSCDSHPGPLQMTALPCVCGSL